MSPTVKLTSSAALLLAEVIGNCCRGQSVKAYLKTKASCLFHSQELASVLCGNNLCKVCIRYGINCCHTLRNLLCGDKRAVCCSQSITQRVIASHCQASFTGTRSVDGKVHSVIPVCFRILRLGLRNDGLLIIVICRLNGRSVSRRYLSLSGLPERSHPES